ncbi:PAS domain-containing protein [Olivibacter jilunii]|uniref:PAS domain-containing protein n=1 Tax=Olivibacter jilunii TaxID=985016 RepID=UPI003F151B5A
MDKLSSSCNSGKEQAVPKHLLVDHAPVAMYTCDPSGRITFYNRAAAELWGREPEINQDLWCGSWKAYYPDGSTMSPEECPMAKVLRQQMTIMQAEVTIERPEYLAYTAPHWPLHGI